MLITTARTIDGHQVVLTERHGFVNILPSVEARLATNVYRIVPLSHLLNDIANNELTFARVWSWQDRYEAFILKCPMHDSVTGGAIGLDTLGMSMFGSCWSFTQESDAMWQIYQQTDKHGVQVSVSVDNLLSAWRPDAKKKWHPLADGLHRLKHFCGVVEYLKENDVQRAIDNFKFDDHMTSDGSLLAALALVKRDKFIHEDELRLLYWSDHADEPTTFGDEVGMPDGSKRKKFLKRRFDWQVVKSIVISPYADDSVVANVKGKIALVAPWMTVTKSAMNEFTPRLVNP